MKNKVDIEISVPIEDPNGLMSIRIPGRTLKAFLIPRSDVKEIKNLKESEFPVVYFLFGNNEEEEKPMLYIGQTDNFFRRLSQQVTSKDYWDKALIFTAEFDIDVMYLEKKCVSGAKESGRYKIKNDTGAPGKGISESRININEKFFDDIKFITTLLNFPVFQITIKEKQVEQIYILEDYKNKDAFGRGALLPSGEFVVYAGSLARIKETNSFKGSGPRLRKKLFEEEVIKIKDQSSYIFSRNYIFKSPSAAGDAISGRSTNGWTAWKDKDGKTLDDNLRSK